ncbi:imidazoleglycerol-phosphate synthase [Sugiyamaella lignohabitans]|uniref:Imidazole glycerol phosphate synthase hisHF n=1 Tax=Sugiyamaella lignohabitans TaxID=796027 RepID=A0A167CTQ9_9ASCO|nr:imidazoleglycerol-phosphate synthase [Sugiyamaella lignohabitans]ANB12094.1 imidazoleglycerol-phosphate synthase [Sugiyamaella lignohabitans]
MSDLVYVIDVESGNLQSLQNAVEKLGYRVKWVKNREQGLEAVDKAQRMILPGVGNFGHFMDELHGRGLADTVLEYIKSGKPLMGICVGLQSIFKGSVESPTAQGLGLIDIRLSRFDDSEKSVPHIGWNGTVLKGQEGDDITKSTPSLYGIDPSQKYYFVHSFAAVLSNETQIQALQGWEYAQAQYGSEKFVAAVAKDNVFLTQFHPEKSGEAGLFVIDSFLKGNKHARISTELASHKTAPGLTKRVIACLDVRTNDAGDIVVTKGDQYDVREKEGSAVRNLGKPVQVAEKYYKQGADEVTFLNITSFRNSPLKDLPMLEILRLTSKTVFVPLTIGGGIRDTVDPATGKVVPALEVADMYFRSGADKVSIGSDAVDAAEKYYANGRKGDGTSPLETISKPYGVQAVVVSIDPKRVYVQSPSDVKHHTFKTKYPGPNGEEYVWYQTTVKGGRETRDLGAYELAQASEALGAGELLLNCIDKDGTNSGFDLELINDIKSAVKIPVIASSGAGRPEHFEEVFTKTTTDAALGAGMFHRDEYTVSDVKKCLQTAGFPTRLT